MTKRHSVYYRAAQMIARGDERYSCIAVAMEASPEYLNNTVDHSHDYSHNYPEVQEYLNLMSPVESPYYATKSHDLQGGIEDFFDLEYVERREAETHLRVMLLLMMDAAS